MRPSAEKARSEPGADLYLAAVGTTNKSSIETYLTILGSVIARAPKPLLKLTPAEVRALGAGIKEKDRSAHQFLRELRKFYRANRRRALLEAVPKTKANNDSTVGPDDILTVEEVNAMLGAAVQKRDAVLVLALYETAGRIHEVLSLDVEDLTRHENGGNGGRPWYKAWFRKVKVDGEQHYGYIREPASVAALEDFLRSYPSEITACPRPLIPSFSAVRGTQRLTPTGANQMLKAMARRAGVAKRMHAHVFKHTRVTHLLRAGMPEATVKKLVGWSPSSKMLARYAHLVNEDVERDLGLSGEAGKPAEILLPKRFGDLPAMADLPFRVSPRRVAELEAKIEGMERDRERLVNETLEAAMPTFVDKFREMLKRDGFEVFEPAPEEKARVERAIKEAAGRGAKKA